MALDPDVYVELIRFEDVMLRNLRDDGQIDQSHGSLDWTKWSGYNGTHERTTQHTLCRFKASGLKIFRYSSQGHP